MKKTAQSIIEFAIILMIVTLIAIISLQIINNKINSTPNKYDIQDEKIDESISQEEANCNKMGLHWDRQNGICEAK